MNRFLVTATEQRKRFGFALTRRKNALLGQFLLGLYQRNAQSLGTHCGLTDFAGIFTSAFILDLLFAFGTATERTQQNKLVVKASGEFVPVSADGRMFIAIGFDSKKRAEYLESVLRTYFSYIA